MPEYVDVHRDEPIISSCPFCHLPIYQSDPRNELSSPKGGRPRLYHSGCALQLRGHDLEAQLTLLLKELRGLGYHVDMQITRPVGSLRP